LEHSADVANGTDPFHARTRRRRRRRRRREREKGKEKEKEKDKDKSMMRVQKAVEGIRQTVTSSLHGDGVGARWGG
jgi:hypothetical protein